MTVLKAIAISFSMYSKIPMPHFEWEDRTMKYALVFFPLVGLVIGMIFYGWLLLGISLALPELVQLLIGIAIPLLLTGGFHVDGFLDVSDARASYGSREKKLEILKDPHIGAFAVIRLILAGLIYAAALTMVIHYGNREAFAVLGLSFVLSRIACAISSISMPKARKDGMLQQETKGTNRTTLILLGIEGLLCLCAMAYFGLLMAGISLLGLLLVTVYYCLVIPKEFGGVTGDTAGYYLVLFEIVQMLLFAIFIYLI